MSKLEIQRPPMQEELPRYKGWIGDESSGWPEVKPQTDEVVGSPSEEEFRGAIRVPAELDS